MWEIDRAGPRVMWMVASTGPSPAPVDELFRVFPRFVDRTSRQVEVSRVLLGHVPCIGERMISLGVAKRALADPASRTGTNGTVVTPTPVATTGGPTTVDADGRGPGGAPGTGADGARAMQVPDEAELAIPEYDSLAASQVIPRLEMLQPSDLRQILHYEENKRNRQTIVHKVGQLLAGAADR